jgi:hypothetical protein
MEVGYKFHEVILAQNIFFSPTIKLMGPFSRREGCPQSPDIIEVENMRTGKIHRMESTRYLIAATRLEGLIKARARAEHPEPEKPDKFPRAATLFRVFKLKLPTRSLGATTSSPAGRTSTSNATR